MRAIFLDIEANGLDSRLHIPLEIALSVVDLSDNRRYATHTWLICPTLEEWAHSDPTSIAINGFGWDEVQKGKALEQVRSEIIDLFSKANLIRDNSFFICQNPAFDRSFWYAIFGSKVQEERHWPYHWLDLASMEFALQVTRERTLNQRFPETLSLSKNAIAERYGLPPEQSLHRALNGVEHLILCYQAIFGLKFD